MVRRGNSLTVTFRCSNGIRQRGQLSPLLYYVYTDDLNHDLQPTGVGYYVRAAWANSLSYADDTVLLAPTVTDLQTLLQVCRAYAGLHDIVYNTTKTVCMLVRPKQSQGWYSTRVKLGNDELRFVEEFHYLWHVMTVDCRDEIRILKNNSEGKTSWQYSGREVLICTCGAKIPIVQDILLPNLWMCSLASFLPKLH